MKVYRGFESHLLRHHINLSHVIRCHPISQPPVFIDVLTLCVFILCHRVSRTFGAILWTSCGLVCGLEPTEEDQKLAMEHVETMKSLFPSNQMVILLEADSKNSAGDFEGAVEVGVRLNRFGLNDQPDDGDDDREPQNLHKAVGEDAQQQKHRALALLLIEQRVYPAQNGICRGRSGQRASGFTV